MFLLPTSGNSIVAVELAGIVISFSIIPFTFFQADIILPKGPSYAFS